MNTDIKKINEVLYKFDNVLPLNMFYRAQDEFNPLYNNWAYKLETQILSQSSQEYQPHRMGLAKVSGDTLGWSLPLLEVGAYLKPMVEYTLKEKFYLGRVNTNIQTFGQESTYHRDGSETDWTFLVFLNSEWNAEWGGDFSIQLSPNDYIGFVPIPNSGILFRADVEHKGNAPNRLCMVARYSIAFTFFKVGT